MKRFFVFIISVCISLSVFAQKSVTKFLGIPVDGYKNEMIQKLKNKGFTYDKQYDYFTGEFNGSKVVVSLVTNNNKVWRILINDAFDSDETAIKIRFNNLCRQFEKNVKYVPINGEGFNIPESDDISYKIRIEKKQYEAVYLQLDKNADNTGENKAIDEKRVVWFKISERYGDYRITMFYDNEYNHADGEDL